MKTCYGLIIHLQTSTLPLPDYKSVGTWTFYNIDQHGFLNDPSAFISKKLGAIFLVGDHSRISDFFRELGNTEFFETCPFVICSNEKSIDKWLSGLDFSAQTTHQQEASHFYARPSCFGKYTVDHITFQISCEDQFVQLTPKECQIVTLLLKNSEKDLTQKEIQEYVWRGVSVATKTFDVHLHNLRKKIEPLNLDVQHVGGRKYRINKTYQPPTDAAGEN